MLIHVVKPGESLYLISQKYGVSMNKIVKDNQISEPTRLVVGQALIIRKEKIVYTIKPKDTLYDISKRFEISLEKLLETNNLTVHSILTPGQQLDIIYDDHERVPMEINAYVYPNVELDILRESLPYLTYLSIFSYQVKEDGALTNINDEEIIREAYKFNVAPIMVLTNIDQPGQFSSELISTILNDENLQDQLLQNILEVVQEKSYYGVDFDFEYLYPSDREPYNRFLEKASAFLGTKGYKLSSAIAPKLSGDQKGLLYEAHDYAAHGRILDDVIIMTYEWGYIFSEAMPVAPVNMVEKVIQYAETQIPNEKILMGVPNYGYIFEVPKIEDVPALLITNPQAVDIAWRENAEIKFDEIAKSPYFTYYDEDKKLREVHFEDARSIKAKVLLAIDYQLGGLSYWTVMSFFKQNWVVLNHYVDVVKVINNDEIDQRYF